MVNISKMKEQDRQRKKFMGSRVGWMSLAKHMYSENIKWTPTNQYPKYKQLNKKQAKVLGRLFTKEDI